MYTSIKKLLLPSNLDLEQLLKEKPSGAFKGVTPDYLAFICHTLITLKSMYREDNLKANGLVRMSARILNKNVYSYRPCLDYLLDAGVIISDLCYSVGIESTGYDFSPAFLGFGFKEYEIKNPRFKRTLTRRATERQKQTDKALKSVEHLTRFFDQRCLHLDYGKALAWIEESRQLHLKALVENCLIHDMEAFYAAKINERHDLYKVSIGRFKAGNFNCSVDTTGYRFHSILTNLKSELRNFISYAGKKLVSVDIKNSQPYFSLLLFKESFYAYNRDRNSMTLKNLYSELYNYLRQSSAWEKLKTLAEGSDGLAGRYISIECYKKAVLNGIFYEELAEFVNLDTGGKISLIRMEAKKQAFILLFGNPRSRQISNANAYKSFHLHYPNVARIFNLFKSRPVNDSSAVHYQDLPILLQRIESYMVIHIITKKFHSAFPEAPIFTIHDCVTTDLEHKDSLAQIIQAELTNVLGAAPTLKFEYWKPENATVKICEDIYR